MRRLLWLPAVLAALVCGAGVASTVTSTGFYTTTTTETQPCDAGTCTGTAPTSVASGASLNWIAALRLRSCASLGQTFQGAGSFQAYLCGQTSQLCYRNTALDQAVTASGVRCVVFPDFVVPYVTEATETVEFVPNGVTVSGTDGGVLTVDIMTYRQRLP